VIQVSNSNVDMPTAFAAIVSLAALGVGLYLIVSLVERRLLSWHESAMDT
jgi:ABC-type nitrate/sulfonate/bicarbonate transport system permease component